MPQNLKIVHNGVGPWTKGDVVSEQHVHELLDGGTDRRGREVIPTDKQRSDAVQRLLDIGAVERTDAEVTIGGERQDSPEHTKGDNVDPGSDDTVEARRDRRAEAVGPHNAGGPNPGDAAVKANPRGGRPGTVARAANPRAAATSPAANTVADGEKAAKGDATVPNAAG